MKGTRTSPRMLPHFLITCEKDIKKPLNIHLEAFLSIYTIESVRMIAVKHLGYFALIINNLQSLLFSQCHRISHRLNHELLFLSKSMNSYL